MVTSSAGYPLDKTYYQTIKGMVTPLDILEPGGTLIIASQCSEGFGSPEFREAQTRLVKLGQERFLATLTAKSLAEIDEWQTEMQLKSLRLGRVELYTSGLMAADRAITGVHVVSDLDFAIAASMSDRRTLPWRSFQRDPMSFPSTRHDLVAPPDLTVREAEAPRHAGGR